MIYTLTEREHEILRLIADGLSNDEIARKLTLTLGTVKWYNTQIFSKLGVRSRTEAIAHVQRRSALPTSQEAEPVKLALPAQPTPFTGREVELSELDALCMDGERRLITLVGPGGIGKTRLALELAERQAQHYRDGVYFVPLAPLSAADDITPAIAIALGLRSAEGVPAANQIASYLRDRQTLLLLDNFDLLLDAAALVADILRAAPRVRIVATSRERLNLLEETLYHVDGMEVPSLHAPASLQHNQAVRLFLQHALRAHPDMQVDTVSLHQIAHICRLVEGMPLAIILAAAWVEVLTPGEIALEIARSLDFLSSGLRDMPERHQSMRAVFNSSWQRLSDLERQAFACMAVFRGGFTREAAEVVTRENLRTLMGLVHKSLVRRTSDSRFEIHELLRQFAGEQLAIADGTHARHMDYYLDLIASQPDGTVIDADFENVRTAWGRAVEQGSFDAIDRALDGLNGFCLRRGRYQDASRLYDAALERAALVPGVSQAVLLRLHECRGDTRFARGEFEGAIADIMYVRDQTRAAGDTAREQAMRVRLGNLFRRAERHDDAIANLSAALDYAHAHHNGHMAADILYHLGTVYWDEGENQEAFERHRQAVQLVEQLGLSDLVAAQAYHGFGETLLYAGQPENALHNFLRAHRIAEGIGHVEQVAENLEMAGWTLMGHIGSGDYARAHAYYEQSLAITEPAQLDWHTACTLHGMGVTQAALGDYASAIESVKRGIEVSRMVGVTRFYCMGLDALGTLYQDIGQYAQAEALHTQAMEHLLHLEWSYWVPRAQANRAIDRLRMGDLSVGSELQGALDMGLTTGQIAHAVRALEGLCELHIAMQQPLHALDHADHLLRIAIGSNMVEMQASGHRWRGEALMLLDRCQEAEAALGQAQLLADQTGRRLLMRDVHLARARCLDALQRREDGVSQRAAAERIRISVPQP